MKNSHLFSPNRQAMILSIGFHVLGLALLYFRHTPAVSRISPGQSYTIALQPTAPYTPKKDDLSQNKPRYQMQAADTPGKKNRTFSKNRLKNSSIRSRRKYQKNKTNAQTVQKNLQSYKAPQIDKRGLYNTGKSGAKQAGATLELKGWEWDSVPRPNDSTEECGKIVFEIKVDKYGEIISIQTIEKTVTPMVEKIYADALRSLTFSKTAEQPSDISTGKVTFVLVAR